MNLKRYVKAICLIAAVAMLIMMEACTKQVNSDVSDPSQPEDSSSTSGTISDETGSGEGPDSSETTNSSNSGSSNQNNQKTNQNKTNSVTTTSKAGTKPMTSLTRDQVIAKMPAKLRGTKLVYFYWWDPYTQMDKEAIEAFTKATGITVIPDVCSYSERTNELAAKISAGNSPDIVRTLTNANYQIKPLQPITNSGFDFNDTAWDHDLMKDYTFNGRTYAVNLKNSAILDVAVLYYNKRALKLAEMEDPYQIWKKNPNNWTWDKLWSMCQEFLDANNNKNGYYGICFQYNNSYVRAFGAANYYYDSNKGKWVNNMRDPEVVKRWTIMLQAYEKKLSAVNNDPAAFHRGQILFNWAGPFAARTRDETHAILKKNGTLGVVPIPTDSKYQVLYEYTAFGIPQGAKNPEAVPYYLRYVLDKQSYDLNQVYFDEQAKDSVEAAQARGNFFFGENELWDLRAALLKGGPSQVKSVIDSFYGVIQEKVDNKNKEIEFFAK